MKSVSIVGLFMAASLSINVYAIHVDMKPGLWEHSFKLNDSSLSTISNEQKQQMDKMMEGMKKQMESMPPEQRKMMEEMMTKQGIKISDKGVDMPEQGVHISKDGTSVKVCVTKEEIERGEIPKADDNCEEKITQVSPSSFKVSYLCKGEHPSHGEGQVVFQSDKAYTGTMKLTTELNNKMENIEGAQSGKWLSSDCGNIKPLQRKIK